MPPECPKCLTHHMPRDECRFSGYQQRAARRIAELEAENRRLRAVDASVSDANESLSVEVDRLRDALTRIYQSGTGRHVEIARQALDGVGSVSADV